MTTFITSRAYRLFSWLKKEAVFSAAWACALVSMLFVPPDKSYLAYIDFRVLALLFCLMVVVAGFQTCGLFILAARRLLAGGSNLRLLAWLLIMLPFFSSMLITNDVSLITFVPFSILILGMTGQKKHLAGIVTLQTIAANLGSMTTPVGNPQNLYLYGRFGIPAADFFKTLLPITGISFLLLTLSVLGFPKASMNICFEDEKELRPSVRQLFLFSFLFLLCLLSVFRILPYGLLLAIVIVCILGFCPSLLQSADYMLLLTFVAFFLFAGNIGRVRSVQDLLGKVLNANPTLFSALTSQVISNVPAAVLLSGFTDNWRALLAGTNLGGLGTPIASLASLISLKFYTKEIPKSTARYLAVFSVYNLLFFVILYFAATRLLGV